MKDKNIDARPIEKIQTKNEFPLAQIQSFIDMQNLMHQIKQPLLGEIIPLDNTAYMTAKQIWIQNIKDGCEQVTQLRNKAQQLMRVLHHNLQYNRPDEQQLKLLHNGNWNYQYRFYRERRDYFKDTSINVNINVGLNIEDLSNKKQNQQKQDKYKQNHLIPTKNQVSKEMNTKRVNQNANHKQYIMGKQDEMGSKNQKISRTKQVLPKQIQRPKLKIQSKQIQLKIKKKKSSKGHQQSQPMLDVNYKRNSNQNSQILQKFTKFRDQNIDNSNFLSSNKLINRNNNSTQLPHRDYYNYENQKFIHDYAYNQSKLLNQNMKTLPEIINSNRRDNMNGKGLNYEISKLYQQEQYNNSKIQVLPLLTDHTDLHRTNIGNLNDFYSSRYLNPKQNIKPVTLIDRQTKNTDRIIQLNKKEYKKQVPCLQQIDKSRQRFDKMGTNLSNIQGNASIIYVKCDCSCTKSKTTRMDGSQNHQNQCKNRGNMQQKRDKIIKNTSKQQNQVQRNRRQQKQSVSPNRQDILRQKEYSHHQKNKREKNLIFQSNRNDLRLQRQQRVISSNRIKQIRINQGHIQSVEPLDISSHNCKRNRSQTYNHSHHNYNSNKDIKKINLNKTQYMQPDIIKVHGVRKSESQNNQFFEDDLDVRDSCQVHDQVPKRYQYTHQAFNKPHHINATINYQREIKTQMHPEQHFHKKIEVIKPAGTFGRKFKTQTISDYQSQGNIPYKKTQVGINQYLSPQQIQKIAQIQKQYEQQRSKSKSVTKEHKISEEPDHIQQFNIYKNNNTFNAQKNLNQGEGHWRQTQRYKEVRSQVSKQKQIQQKQKQRQISLLKKLKEQFSQICSQQHNQDEKRVSQQIKQLQARLNSIISENNRQTRTKLKNQSHSPSAKVVRLNLTPSRQNIHKNGYHHNYNHIHSNYQYNQNANYVQQKATPRSPINKKQSQLLSKRIQNATKFY